MRGRLLKFVIISIIIINFILILDNYIVKINNIISSSSSSNTDLFLNVDHNAHIGNNNDNEKLLDKKKLFPTTVIVAVPVQPQLDFWSRVKFGTKLFRNKRLRPLGDKKKVKICTKIAKDFCKKEGHAPDTVEYNKCWILKYAECMYGNAPFLPIP